MTQRYTPKHLARKLKQIREHLEIKTFDEMISRLNINEVPLYRASIHEYEKGTREPPLIVLLRYARLANVAVDVLIDDELDLPKSLKK